MAILVKADGTLSEIEPKDKISFRLEELHALTHPMIDFVRMGGGMIIVVGCNVGDEYGRNSHVSRMIKRGVNGDAIIASIDEVPFAYDKPYPKWYEIAEKLREYKLRIRRATMDAISYAPAICVVFDKEEDTKAAKRLIEREWPQYASEIIARHQPDNLVLRVTQPIYLRSPEQAIEAVLGLDLDNTENLGLVMLAWADRLKADAAAAAPDIIRHIEKLTGMGE